ncbi:hypothetical protein AVEN_123725-1 [Araneus ventricosus]|uniref:Uncharacterized protein n=1 Tax=Araneus ventricosus TaxID=182803 RepID=A0A4Y2K546_ARAVE|nr:hypothetical protein AVEN_123725-1 [Araneus ventricosus]
MLPAPPKLFRYTISFSQSLEIETVNIGLTLNRHLTFENYIQNIKRNYKGAKAKLFPISGCDSQLSHTQTTKLLNYKNMPCSLISYVSLIWATADKTHREVQSKAARRICNKAMFTRSNDIQKDIKQTSVTDYYKNLSKNFFEKQVTNNSVFREIAGCNLNNPKTIIRIIRN